MRDAYLLLNLNISTNQIQKEDLLFDEIQKYLHQFRQV